jgi:hypothetical protein
LGNQTRDFSDAMQAALDPMLAVSKGRLIVEGQPLARIS